MPTDPPPRAPSREKPPSRFTRPLDAKLTPGVIALFFVALAVVCALATGIGAAMQHLRHAEVHRS